jgi:hypothetical protein
MKLAALILVVLFKAAVPDWILVGHIYAPQQVSLTWSFPGYPPTPPPPFIPNDTTTFDVFRAEQFCRVQQTDEQKNQWGTCEKGPQEKIATVKVPYFNDVKVLSGHTYVWNVVTRCNYGGGFSDTYQSNEFLIKVW